MQKEKMLSASDLSLFCYQLSLIFKSGIPILDGMEIFAKDMMDPRLKEVAQDMQQQLAQGYSLHSVIEKYKFFPVYLTSMVKIAEQTGNLQDELERLSDYYEQTDRLNNKIKSAVTYPLILLVLMAGVILFLVLKVLPMFHEILLSLGGDIPVSTKIMIDLANILKTYALAIIGILIIAIALLLYYFKSQKNIESGDKILFKLPWINATYKKIISARLANAMTMMLKAGSSFDEALDMSKKSVGNAYVESLLEAARLNIINGSDPVKELDNLGIFPVLFMKMLKIGHMTGELESSLSKISVIYDKEVEKSLSKITTMIEPALVTILSLIIGVVLFTVMLPLINIIAAIG